MFDVTVVMLGLSVSMAETSDVAAVVLESTLAAGADAGFAAATVNDLELSGAAATGAVFTASGQREVRTDWSVVAARLSEARAVTALLSAAKAGIVAGPAAAAIIGAGSAGVVATAATTGSRFASVAGAADDVNSACASAADCDSS
jgi:hypothetical protein